MYSNKFPPKWRLWHPNQGIVFQQQQPLYPVLDVARFFTEASVVEDTGSSPAGLGQEVASNCFKNNGDHSDNAAGPQTYQAPRAGTAPAEESNQGLSSSPIETAEPEAKKEEAEPAAAAEALPRGPPFTPLDYKIPEESFSAAVEAAEGTSESFWSYAMYRCPSGDEDGRETDKKVTVHYCKSAHIAERVCRDYFLNEKVIGFDLEWSLEGYRTPSPRKNVSLVQLASQSRVALLHVAVFPNKDEDRLVPPALKTIMENPEITKTGVWIKGDCTRLQKYLGIESRGIFELSHLFRQVKYTKTGRYDLINKKLVRLADQVQETMHLPMFKGADVRTSDWSKPLNMDQIVYSASDAYAAVQLYAMLNHQREELDPAPPMPFHVEQNKPIPLAPGHESSSSDEAEFAEDEEEDKMDAGYTGSTLTPEQLRALGESIQVEAGEDDSNDSKATREVTKPAKVKSRSAAAAAARKQPTPPKDPRVVAAEAWLMEYKATRPEGKTKAGGAALRAYFLWHGNDDLSVDDVAKLLRDPPLQLLTVCGYILEAVRVEKLAYDRVRLRQVLDLYPQDVAQRRFAPLVRATAKANLSVR